MATLDELVVIHTEVMSTVSQTSKRYLYDKIDWNTKAICLKGERGVGKTTMICQYLLEKYESPDKALYISADNINVTAIGLFNIAREYFAYGGQALFIDEIHKYSDWSVELKNIIDTYRKHQIVFTGSSSLNLEQSKADLSRRVVYHKLLGVSFREFLTLSLNIEVEHITLENLINHHVKIANQFKGIPILKYFSDYLEYGYYPFFLEGLNDYLAKVNNMIEKVLFEDIAVVYNLRQTTIPILKKLLWLIATSVVFTPNIDSISKNLSVSRDIIYNCLEHLNHSGLLNSIYPEARGMKLVRKPGKIYMSNTNLLNAINGNIYLTSDIGNIRETFIANQLSSYFKIGLHDEGDFIIDGKYIIEVGGNGKTDKQIKSLDNAYSAIDGIEIGFGRRIPLYLFGLLY